MRPISHFVYSFVNQLKGNLSPVCLIISQALLMENL